MWHCRLNLGPCGSKTCMPPPSCSTPSQGNQATENDVSEVIYRVTENICLTSNLEDSNYAPTPKTMYVIAAPQMYWVLLRHFSRETGLMGTVWPDLPNTRWDTKPSAQAVPLITHMMMGGLLLDEGQSARIHKQDHNLQALIVLLKISKEAFTSKSSIGFEPLNTALKSQQEEIRTGWARVGPGWEFCQTETEWAWLGWEVRWPEVNGIREVTEGHSVGWAQAKIKWGRSTAARFGFFSSCCGVSKGVSKGFLLKGFWENIVLISRPDTADMAVTKLPEKRQSFHSVSCVLGFFPVTSEKPWIMGLWRMKTIRLLTQEAYKRAESRASQPARETVECRLWEVARKVSEEWLLSSTCRITSQYLPGRRVCHDVI